LQDGTSRIMTPRIRHRKSSVAVQTKEYRLQLLHRPLYLVHQYLHPPMSRLPIRLLVVLVIQNRLLLVFPSKYCTYPRRNLVWGHLEEHMLVLPSVTVDMPTVPSIDVSYLAFEVHTPQTSLTYVGLVSSQRIRFPSILLVIMDRKWLMYLFFIYCISSLIPLHHRYHAFLWIFSSSIYFLRLSKFKFLFNTQSFLNFLCNQLAPQKSCRRAIFHNLLEGRPMRFVY